MSIANDAAGCLLSLSFEKRLAQSTCLNVAKPERLIQRLREEVLVSPEGCHSNRHYLPRFGGPRANW